MIDLTTVTESGVRYDIKLYDGTELHLVRPTQELQRRLADIYANEFESDGAALSAIFATFAMVLNRNDAGVRFEEPDLDEYDVKVAAYVIGDYFRFWNDDTNNRVDFQ